MIEFLATSKSNYDYYGVEIFRDTENTGVRNRLVEPNHYLELCTLYQKEVLIDKTFDL